MRRTRRTELSLRVGGENRTFAVGSDGFALHPEVTFMKSFRDDGVLLYMLGLGFNFGKLPSFADTAER